MRYQGPYTWNNLPLHIKSMHSIPSFKNAIKQHLINKYCSFLLLLFISPFPYCYHEIYCQQIYYIVILGG